MWLPKKIKQCGKLVKFILCCYLVKINYLGNQLKINKCSHKVKFSQLVGSQTRGQWRFNFVDDGRRLLSQAELEGWQRRVKKFRTWIYLTEHLIRSYLFFWFGKESLSSFLPIFRVHEEQCSLLLFLLFIFEIRAQGALDPLNHFIMLYDP